MPVIPEKVRGDKLIGRLTTCGLELVGQGKVRMLYRIPEFPGDLLFVATDRISVFDFVLPVSVPYKGQVLTALTHFWLTGPLAGLSSHVIWRPERPKQNAAVMLKKIYPQIPLGRSMVVRRCDVQPFEMIYRAHVGGSVWTEYEKYCTIGGEPTTPGMRKWTRLTNPAFTPSTKETDDHDVNISAAKYFELVGEGRGKKTVEMLASAFHCAYAYAQGRGITILDTKFEVSADGSVVVDEVLTPDSSRYTDTEDWQRAWNEAREPKFLDKQPVRDWANAIETPWGKGLRALSPKNQEHLEFVANLAVPNYIIRSTSMRYLDILERLTGKTLFDYQKSEMGIDPCVP